jgi:hypothetical protein
MMYCGTEEIKGYHNYGADDSEPRLFPWEHPDRFGVTVQVASDVAETILRELVRREFDVAISRSLPPYEGRRKAPHGLVRPLQLLLPSAAVPVVPILMKTVERTPAALTGERCLELGRAIASICQRMPQKIALFGSGGMSHDPAGPRACWVDEPLDRWFLDRLAAGKPDELSALFSFRSAATDSGTGELRTWLPVAAAMDAVQPGLPATVVDYFAARKSTAGCGWVYWDAAQPATVLI